MLRKISANFQFSLTLVVLRKISPNFQFSRILCQFSAPCSHCIRRQNSVFLYSLTASRYSVSMDAFSQLQQEYYFSCVSPYILHECLVANITWVWLFFLVNLLRVYKCLVASNAGVWLCSLCTGSVSMNDLLQIPQEYAFSPVWVRSSSINVLLQLFWS